MFDKHKSLDVIESEKAVIYSIYPKKNLRESEQSFALKHLKSEVNNFEKKERRSQIHCGLSRLSASALKIARFFFCIYLVEVGD